MAFTGDGILSSPRRNEGRAPRSGRGIRLPDVSDVPQVGVTRDPGLDVRNIGAPIADAMMGAASDIQRARDPILQAAQRQQKQIDANATSEAYIAYQRAGMDDLSRRQLEDDTSRETFARDYDDWLDAKVGEVMATLPEGVSEEARADLQFRLQNQRLSLYESAGRLQLVAMQNKSLDLIQQQSNTMAAQAMRSPELLDDILAMNDDALAPFAGTLGADSERDVRAASRSSIIESALGGLADSGRFGEARRLLQSGRFDADLSPDRVEVIGNRIDRAEEKARVEAERAAARARNEFLSGFEDYAAYLQNGGTPTGRYTTENVKQAIGGADGEKLAAELSRAEEFGKLKSKVEFATPAEITAMVQKEAADLSSPAEFRTEQAELASLARIISDRETRLARDPAAYVMGADSVRQAYERMLTVTGDPTATQEERTQVTADYANAAEAEQLRLGVPETAVRLLPKPHADQVVARFQSQVHGGENAANLMQSMAEQWGTRWPQVYGEMAADLPSAAVVIGSGMSPAAATLLAEAAKSPKALKDAIPTATQTEVRDAVSAELSQFAATVIGQPGGVNTIGVWQEGTELLALSYVARGDDPQTAAERAAGETVNDKYIFRDTFRIPIEEPNPERIAGGAAWALYMLPADRLSNLPTSLFGLPPEDVRPAYRAALVNKGYWVTAPDESGLVLYDETSSVVLVDGKPYTLTWEQLRNAIPAEPGPGEGFIPREEFFGEGPQPPWGTQTPLLPPLP